MVKIKICGITNLGDALDAAAAGADLLGFNFYRPSPRYIKPEAAREIIAQLAQEIVPVGVFVNEALPAQVEEIASAAGVRALQLHGDESPEYCEALADRFVIKVLAIGTDFDARQAHAYQVPAIMVDALDRKARGGTGRTIDWSLARQVAALVPRLFLAGGLSPENVATAISVVHPYAVDSCSALEVTPGKKDPERVRAFIHAVRAGDDLVQGKRT